jgi:hypothetical protein
MLTTMRPRTAVSPRQAWRDVVLKPGADQPGDAVQVPWLLVPQDADRAPLLGQDVLEAAEPWVL